jgi:16S rRNA G966 N2-methylase RsmD
MNSEVVQSEAEEFLRRPLARRGRAGSHASQEPWDLVYFDPPYATDYLGVLKLLGANAGALLAEGGCVVVEHHHKNALPDEVGIIRRQRILKQGDSALSFYVMAASVGVLRDFAL